MYTKSEMVIPKKKHVHNLFLKNVYTSTNMFTIFSQNSTQLCVQNLTKVNKHVHNLFSKSTQTCVQNPTKMNKHVHNLFSKKHTNMFTKSNKK